MTVWGRMTSFFGDDICDDDDKGASGARQYRRSASLSSITLFAAGVSVGFLAASKVGVRKM